MHRTYIVAALGLIAGPALGAEIAVEPPVTLSGSIDNYGAYGVLTNTFATAHELTLTVEARPTADLLVGAEAVLGLAGTFGGGVGTVVVANPTLELYAEHATLGRIAALDTDDALDARCITATAGSEHFGAEDFMAFGTCGGYGGQGISYTTPDFSGFKVTVSAHTDLWGFAAVGDIENSVSIAASYEGEVSGVAVEASAGLSHALSIKGGLAPGQSLPTVVQAGVRATKDGWTVGVSGQYEVASLTGGNSAAGAIGIGQEVVPGLTLMGEVFADAYENAGDPTREVGAGLAAEYIVVPDKVLIDGALWALQRTSNGGVNETDAGFGAGVKFSF